MMPLGNASTVPAGWFLAPRPWEGSLGTIGAAIWVGLAVGLVEVAFFAIRVQLAQSGLFRKSPHVLWMAPVADAALFGVWGLALAALVRPIPGVGRRLSSLLLCTLAVLAPLLAIPGLRAAAGLAMAGGLACWIEPTIRSRADRARRLARRTAPVLALAVLAMAVVASVRGRTGARDASTADASTAGGPNVLLIVLDTVRADATGLNDPGRDTTPNLQALARRGARFDRAIATAPWTLPSHASILTGRSVGELGVGPDRPLDDRFPTLAEYLGRRGYDTAGFVANTAFCSVEYGLARGFEDFHDYAFSTVDLFRSSALGWLICLRLGDVLDLACEATGREASHPLEGPRLPEGRGPDQPRRPPLDRPSTRPALLRLPERLRRPRPLSAARRGRPARWPGADPAGRPEGAEELDRRGAEGPPPRALRPGPRRLRRMPGPSRRSDRPAGRRARPARGAGEHGRHRHCRPRRALRRASSSGAPASRPPPERPSGREVHVPLLIVAHGRVPAGLVVPGSVSLKDLPSTVVDLIGLAEGSPFPGRSILARPASPALVEFNPDVDRPIGLRYQVGASGLIRAVVSGEASLHRHGDGREELYDLRADPGELHDMSADDGAVGLRDRLRGELDDLSTHRGRRDGADRPGQ